ncbi:MAG TPA: lamin tail domain-containing protein [Candidatus Woesebacteria bacterium]|nr:lamin tail domain-containing protein [Candidatus Woesebacteria bacterium]
MSQKHVGVALILMLLFASHCSAQVQINEVLPDPTEGEEAIELIINSSSQDDGPFLLAGWSLWDELNTPSLLHQFESEQLSSGEFLVVYCHNKLNNGGDGVVLKDNWGEIKDHFSYSETQKGLSYSRISPNETFFVITPSTLGLPNIRPTLSPTPTMTHSPTSSPTPSIALSSLAPSPSPTPTPSLLPLRTPTPQPSSSFSASSFAIIQSTTTLTPIPSVSPSTSLDSLNIDQEFIIKDIRSLEQERAKSFYLKNNSRQSHTIKPTLFPNVLAFTQSTFSRRKLLSVIIGGWFFIIASRLIYEKESSY